MSAFFWDREAVIPAPSPFPQRVYFILNLRRFMAVFGSEEKMQTAAGVGADVAPGISAVSSMGHFRP
jgi:hypothetical protein